MSSAPDLTQLLNAQQDGAPGAADEAMPQVYDALRVIARNHLRQERPAHTLNPTALVHEAYVKLIDLDRVTWESRRHFFAMASRSMRRILVDYARRTQADKRGGDAVHVDIDEVPVFADLMPADVIALDDALSGWRRRPSVRRRSSNSASSAASPSTRQQNCVGVSPHGPARLDDGQGVAPPRNRSVITFRRRLRLLNDSPLPTCRRPPPSTGAASRHCFTKSPTCPPRNAPSFIDWTAKRRRSRRRAVLIGAHERSPDFLESPPRARRST